VPLDELGRASHRVTRRAALEHHGGNRERPAREQDQAGNDEQEQPDADSDACEESDPEQRARATPRGLHGATAVVAPLLVDGFDERALNDGRPDEREQHNGPRADALGEADDGKDEAGRDNGSPEHRLIEPRRVSQHTRNGEHARGIGANARCL
jgi:hypothetical protein